MAALLPPGQRVQYNVAAQSPRAAPPTATEQTIGVIRQSFNAFDGPYYQVVWNPGGTKPETGLYHANEICPVSQQTTQATPTGTPGSQYPQRNIPVQAAPAFYQQQGMETL